MGLELKPIIEPQEEHGKGVNPTPLSPAELSFFKSASLGPTLSYASDQFSVMGIYESTRRAVARDHLIKPVSVSEYITIEGPGELNRKFSGPEGVIEARRGRYVQAAYLAFLDSSSAGVLNKARMQVRALLAQDRGLDNWIIQVVRAGKIGGSFSEVLQPDEVEEARILDELKLRQSGEAGRWLQFDERQNGRSYRVLRLRQTPLIAEEHTSEAS